MGCLVACFEATEPDVDLRVDQMEAFYVQCPSTDLVVPGAYRAPHTRMLEQAKITDEEAMASVRREADQNTRQAIAHHAFMAWLTWTVAPLKWSRGRIDQARSNYRGRFDGKTKGELYAQTRQCASDFLLSLTKDM